MALELNEESMVRISGMWVQAGGIHERDGRRVVVTLANDLGVFYEPLPHGARGHSGGCCGPGATLRFLDQWGPPVAQMRFNGAYKLYRREREKRWALERRVRELEAAAAFPVAGWWQRLLRRA